MPRRAVIALAGVLALAGCAEAAAPSSLATTSTTAAVAATTTTAPPAVPTTSTTTSEPAPTTTAPATTTTTTLPPVDALQWARLPEYDPATFGGVAGLPRGAAVPGGAGVVSVGADNSGADMDAAVWFSADGGATREQVPHDEAVFGGPGDQGMTAVVAAGPGLVAVGWERTTAPVVVDGNGTMMNEQVYDAVVWTSFDGITWTRLEDQASVFGGVEQQDDQVMLQVEVGGPGLVAVGYERDRWYRPQARFNVRFGIDQYAAVWTSVDGVTWVRVSNTDGVFGAAPSEYEMRAVASWRGGLVAVGTGVQHGAPGSEWRNREAVVWVSADGITWARVPPDEAVLGGDLYASGVGGHDVEMSAVAAGGPGLVAVGRDREFWWEDGGVVRSDIDAAVWVSADGIAWARVPHDEAVFGGEGIQEMHDVVTTPAGLVAVGFDYASEAAVLWITPPPG